MGMDVHGLNPKHNKNLDDFPVIKRFDSMDFKEKWKTLGKDEALKDEYWREKDKWEASNPGVYFRNSCWEWRPLWNYCYAIADDIISKDVFESGHSNDGAGLNDKDAKLLGSRLMEYIADGRTIEYQAKYEQYLNDLSHNDLDKSYTFDVDNVERFALFCIESGGFEIC